MKFLYSIITGDKNWVYNFQSEKKSESEEIRQKGSPVLKKCKTAVFWNLKNMAHSEFMPPETTVKSEWCETLGKLQA